MGFSQHFQTHPYIYISTILYIYTIYLYDFENIKVHPSTEFADGNQDEPGDPTDPGWATAPFQDLSLDDPSSWNAKNDAHGDATWCTKNQTKWMDLEKHSDKKMDLGKL